MMNQIQNPETKWKENSFLLELKPKNDFANLFLSCAPAMPKEAVRILRDGLEAGGLIENGTGLDEEENGRITASIRGIVLQPSSVQALEWSDNETTMTCRLRAEAVDTVIVPKSTSQIAREIRGEMRLDEFCDKARGKSIKVLCRYCKEPLVDDGKRVKNMEALPSDDWFEQMGPDSLSFFCCSSSGEHTPTSPEPDAKDCLVAEFYFIIDTSLCEEGIVAENTVLSCAHCLSQIGLQMQVDKIYYKLFHSAVALTVDEISMDRSYLHLRFGSQERFFAWFLLKQSEKTSSLKFAIKTLDGSPKLLIWLLDSYAVLVQGCLKITASPDSDPNDRPCEPFPALKMLYKIYSDSEEEDPRTTGQDHSVKDLSLPNASCLELTSLLVQSSQSFPPSCRFVGQFFVGYLRMSDILE